MKKSNQPAPVPSSKPIREKIHNTQLLLDSGLLVVHIRPGKGWTEAGRRGMTVAFERADRSAIRVATSLCKAGDVFCKKLGTKQAIENFQKGLTVFLPVNRRRPVESLLEYFRG